jgi:hypothetical protein
MTAITGIGSTYRVVAGWSTVLSFRSTRSVAFGVAPLAGASVRAVVRSVGNLPRTNPRSPDETGALSSRALPVGPANFSVSSRPIGSHATVGGPASFLSLPIPALPFTGWSGSSSLLSSSSSSPGMASGLLLGIAALVLMIWRRLLRQTLAMPSGIVLSNLVPPG